jgi:hypothetical protein
MAQSIMRENEKDFSQREEHKSKHRTLSERRLRRVCAWFLLFLMLQAELGLAWDRNWHDIIGRDSFWIPPHIMMYTGIGAAGLIALGVVLIDTLRYYRKAPGVDDGSTVRIFWIFHAPIGFIILGYGALTDLVAAPFDNWWHSLYGIDVTLWSPFHLMGTVGGLIIGLGIIYIFASEIAVERREETPPRRFLELSGLEWGVLTTFAGFMELILPTLTAFNPIVLGTSRLLLLTYPLPLTLIAASCLIGLTNLTRKPGSAILAALLLWILAVGTQAFVPWALYTFVSVFGFRFRFANHLPVFNLPLALLPLLFLISALIVDSFAYWQHWRGKSIEEPLRGVWFLGILIALTAMLVPPVIMQILFLFTPLDKLPWGSSVLAPDWLSTLFSAPLVLLAGVVAAIGGAVLGESWYHCNGH